ncbi:hypothetical protein AOLI_G00184130 [Acnodon oligacanthus]
MSKQCTCGKVCKNIHSLKVHQAKIRCSLGEGATQCTGVQPGETQEKPGPESPHRARNLHVLSTNPPSIKSDRRQIKWPAATMTSLWKKFDDDVDQILEAMAKREADRKLEAMTIITVKIAAERFGKEEKKSSRTSYSKNQRAVKTHSIRKFTKDILGQKCSGQLASSQEEIDQQLTQTYSDRGRELELGECNILIDLPDPDLQFDLMELQLKEVREVVHKARKSCSRTKWHFIRSVQELSQTSTASVDKSCESSGERGRSQNNDEWLKRCGSRRGLQTVEIWDCHWLQNSISISLCIENSTQLDQFHIISLLCIEAKIFFGAISKRLCMYLTKNTYIDTSVHKSSITGMPGYVEHTSVVTQLIQEARESKSKLSVLWLDLENAFGSITHKLVQLTLIKHHVPSR